MSLSSRRSKLVGGPLAALLALTGGGVALSIHAAQAGSPAPVAVGVAMDGVPDQAAPLQAYDQMAGRAPAIVMWYQSWSEPLFYPDQEQTIDQLGGTPMITWDPVLRGGAGVPLAAITNGQYDSYLEQAAGQAAAWGQPMYLRFAHEMNLSGPIGPGTNGNTPQSFIAAWRHVVTVFRQAGATNVSWVWSPNLDCGGSCPFGAFYPGDDWVDAVALDGYNYSSVDGVPWASFDQLFGPSYQALTSLTTKPVFIGETASTEAGGNKALWITDAFMQALPQDFPRVRAVLWFDRNKETDWRVNSSASSLAAWQHVVADPLYQGSGDPSSLLSKSTTLGDSGGGTTTTIGDTSTTTTGGTPTNDGAPGGGGGSTGGGTANGSVLGPSKTIALPVNRVAGPSRIGTAIAASRASYPAPGSAQALVLVGDDSFTDALAAGPLAAAVHGPLLETDASGLVPGVAAEMERVLPRGDVVDLVGGDAALSPTVMIALQGLGYQAVRVAGPTRSQTAVAVARALGDPSAVFEATGLSPSDALGVGPVAVAEHGAILLTDGATQDPATRAYLSAHPADVRVAVGGPAARADTGASPVVGANRYETAVDLARRYFPGATAVALASGTTFSDALMAGPVAGTVGAPLLLVNASGPLPSPVAAWLDGTGSRLASVSVYGGTAAVSPQVVALVGG